MNVIAVNRSQFAQKRTSASLLALVLRPAIRFALRHSLKIQDLTRVIKVVLLDVAREEMSRNGTEATLSRLSVMTGIPRKFIGDISEERLEESESGNIITKITGQWQSDRKFTNAIGRPRKLVVEGADSEFAKLVRSVSVDLNPYTVLFELERVGVVLREKDRVELLRSFHLRNSLSDVFEIASEDAADLFHAAEENLKAGQQPRHLHLSTFYDNIPDEAVPAIRRWALKEGSLLHKRARKFLAKFDKDISPKMRDCRGRNRIRLGTFSYTENLESE